MTPRRIGISVLCFAALVFCLAPRLEAAWLNGGTAVCTSTGNQDQVRIVSDATGGAFLVWRDNRSGTYDIYVQHIDAEGNSLWTSGGVAICTDAQWQRSPAIVADGAGGAIIVWTDERNGGSDTDSYAQRVNSAGAVQWTANGVVVCSASYNQQYPQLVADGSGGAIIVWQDARPGTHVDIYAQRMNSSGVAQWTTNGRTICTATGDQVYPLMVSDGSGGAIMAWQDGRNGSADQNIYAQRVTGSGTVQWTSNGVALCTASYNQYSPSLCTDGAGGAIVVWDDMRSNVDFDIYAQRINTTGVTVWTGDGVVVSTAANNQNNAELVTDGAGGAIIVWQDERNEMDIYGQRVDASGTGQWYANGRAVCVIPGEQVLPALISDGGGGAVVTWEDYRRGNWDVFSQHIGPAGNQLTDEAIICTELADDHGLAIAEGEPGGAIIAWKDQRAGNADIYASATPILSVSPTWIDFGPLYEDFADREFVITNTGGGYIYGTVEEACSAFSVVNPELWYALIPDASKTFTVRFQPIAAETSFCTIDTGGDGADVDCSGMGIAPACSVAPDTIDFGPVPVNSHADRSFSITNTGGLRLMGSVTESCTSYNLIAGGGAYDLGGGDTLVVTVRWSPLTDGWSSCAVSAGSSCGSVMCFGTAHRKPTIHLVRDVPGDQGGFVNVAWDRSPGDDAANRLISRYTVWRAIDMASAELAALDPGSVVKSVADMPKEAVSGLVRMEKVGATTYYWKLMSTVEAYYLAGYSEVVPTLFDSTEVCTEYHYLQIIAHTSDPSTFWISDPDSGRSIDNLAPEPPEGLAGEQQYTPAGLLLTWSPNNESDLEGYAIYRGTAAGFVPGPGNLIASTLDTLYLDGDWRWDDGYHYKVAAVDVHGNESKHAQLAPQEVTGAETPAATYLRQNFPNPFNPATKIEFGIAAPAQVVLRIYDASGRLVRTLVDDALPAGKYSAFWDTRNARGGTVASGIYFYRLDAGAYTETRKMTLLR